MTHFVDLSHVLETDMPVYPGDPEVGLSVSDQEQPWHVLSVALGSHSGTHIDAARHYVPDGATIDQYPIERFVVEAVVVRVRAGDDEEIAPEQLTDALAVVPSGGALLLNTGWDDRWGGASAFCHPYLSAVACERLVAAGVGLVGTDAFNVDSSTRGSTHAHEILLGSDVLIVENLTNLSRLAAGQIVHCAFVPLKLAAGDGSPIRAYAWTT
jgi:kynurenine formamidase